MNDAVAIRVTSVQRPLGRSADNGHPVTIGAGDGGMDHQEEAHRGKQPGRREEYDVYGEDGYEDQQERRIQGQKLPAPVRQTHEEQRLEWARRAPHTSSIPPEGGSYGTRARHDGSA